MKSFEQPLDFDIHEKFINTGELFFDKRHPGLRKASILIFSKIFDFSIGSNVENSALGLMDLVQKSFENSDNKEIFEALVAVSDYQRAFEAQDTGAEGGSAETPEEALDRAVSLIQNIPSVRTFIEEAVAA